jgi:hypothetical protein
MQATVIVTNPANFPVADPLQKRNLGSRQHMKCAEARTNIREGLNKADFNAQKWPRLSEQLPPILKWTPYGLPTVQRCPRRRASFATDARRGGHLGAHSDVHLRATLK